MQRVNTLTTAVTDSIAIQEETGNVVIDIPNNSSLTEDKYKQVFDLLAFNRQYEKFIRWLLSDVESMVHCGKQYVDRFRAALQEVHTAVKYKAAVPVATVFPLFAKLWQDWRCMQNIMYLVSTVSRLMTTLAGIQEQMKIPYPMVDMMLQGRSVVTEDQNAGLVNAEDRMSISSLQNYVAIDNLAPGERNPEFLGFCAVCLSVGALVPSNMKIGLIKHKDKLYALCTVRMALRFSKDPERYILEVVQYSRENPHLINLLDIRSELQRVRHIHTLVVRAQPKTKVCDRDVQTEAHPIESYIEKDYTWDLWEWKRRACQWASIVNCKTHSTQTHYSHLRSEIHCQTVHPRDKCLQTMRDAAVSTTNNGTFLWGLRGQLGDGQHNMELLVKHSPERQKVRVAEVCTWPCIEKVEPKSDLDLEPTHDN
ncbi:cilia- and flagella-associated protein 206-like [Leptidea sinapis]|uniref:cilia- and flagella-associated protein 206-like n=1 Tax=Leptidea sinapis TaxID=189913 RepID=UPI0021C40A92|nr:cilia- and flagella-associated protein 206-like [Leptidea sinapis]